MCGICSKNFNFSGGAFPFTVGRIEHGYNVRPDLCATNCKVSPRGFLGKFYTDALVHDAKALNLLMDIIGEVCIFICQTCNADIYKLHMGAKSPPN